MIHVCYSNRTEQLLAALVENLRAERRAGGAFAASHLVVPNRNVEAYVKIRLAEAMGIAANLDVTFLRKLLARVALRGVPGAKLVDVAQLEGFLVDLFGDQDFLATDAMAPVRAYLTDGGANPDGVDRRRFELAAELGRLFDEYGGSRSEMLVAWRSRATLAEHPTFAATEAWQRALWLAIFGPGGLASAGTGETVDGVAAAAAAQDVAGRAWMTLPDLVAAAAQRGALDATDLAPALHVFGVSYMAPAYHQMLAALGSAIDVRVYTLNPCREFWEDVETPGEARRRDRKRGGRGSPVASDARQLTFGGVAVEPPAATRAGLVPLDPERDDENLALRLWARPGRENVRLLNQITDGDFDGCFADHGGGAGDPGHAGAAKPTLLARVQDDILGRVARSSPDPDLRADGSLSVLPCPGIRRELEVVAAEIWRLVRADPTLRFNDVAVIVPERSRDAYLAHAGAVFGESHALPHCVIDLPLGGGHRLGQAVELLLAFPFGAFSLKEMVPLVTHPSLMARFPDADPAVWLRLCDELGIVHGADRRDHDGTYITRDLFNWDQGLRRIALGAFMTGARSGDDDSAVPLGGNEYLPAEPAAGEEATALEFALLARALIEDAHFATGVTGPRERPLREWLTFIRGLLTGYLVPVDDDESALLGRWLRAIDDLEEIRVARPVSYRIAAEWARRTLAAIGGVRGQYLAHGVTVASFVPMRAIPFRVVFALGLGQGAFPSMARRSALDLRGARRELGDVTPREQDLYMFLETLLCARDKLVLSYVARDELTGDQLVPSSVVLELQEILAQGYLAPAELEKLVEQPPPLRRFDDAGRLDALPLAGREHRAKLLGDSLRAVLPAGAEPDIAALRRALPVETFAPLADRLGVLTPPVRPAETATLASGVSVAGPASAQTAASPVENVVVSLAAIRQFLEDPLQGSARFRLRMREIDGDEDIVDRQDEPFALSPRDRTIFLREVMARALTQSRDVPGRSQLAAVAALVARRDELRGAAPTGLFGAASRVAHEAILEDWRQQIEAIAAGRPMVTQVSRFGRAAEHDDASAIHDPIVLDVEAPDGTGGEPRRLRVEIVGRTELIARPQGGAAGSLILSSRRRDDRTRWPKERLRAFVDHLALSAADLEGSRTGPERDRGHAAIIVWANGDTRRLDRTRFREVAAAQARRYLGDVVCDMLTGVRDAAGRATGVHAYLLPCEAVFEARTGKVSLTEAVEAMRDLYFEQPWIKFSSVYGPVPEAVERHEPPPLDEASAMAERRFGLFFELFDDGEAA